MKPLFNPADFSPQIWETTHKGERLRFLVCGKRYLRTPFTENDRGGKQCDSLTHPVAILCAAPATIFFALTDDSHEWKVSLPHEHGIGDSAARAALAEAWRSVEGITVGGWPATAYRFHFKSNISVASDDLAKPQEKTALRNITAWLHWGEWTKKEMSLAERAKTLTSMGLVTTGKALERAAGEAGL
jgi:hypothetical protein